MLHKQWISAIEFAAKAHEGQLRKGTRTPYIVHPLNTFSLAIEYSVGVDHIDGAMEASLLHDVIEDSHYTHADIEASFGKQVADIVLELSDTTVKPKPPWKDRKLKYIENIPHKSKAALFVAMCDKLDNLHATIRDFRSEGALLWSRFNAPKTEIQWYYDSLVETIGITLTSKRLLDMGPLYREFSYAARVLREL